MNNKPISAIAVFSGQVTGHVKFTEDVKYHRIKIELQLRGLEPNSLHGFHVHEAGMKKRHVGDLGNIETNSKGDAKYHFYDSIIKLSGSKSNIIDRGLIIHEDEDDCGNGGNAESLKTGNAGKRIACAVIGYSKDNFKC